MTASGRNIFRQKALDQYRLRQEQDILPPLIRPKIALSLWIVSGLLIGIGILLWSMRVPTLISASGTVIQLQQGQEGASAGDVFAILLLNPAQRNLLRVRMPVTLHLGNSDEVLHQSITSIEPEVLGPEAVQQRFHLHDLQVQMLSGPVIIALVRLGPATAAQTLVGSNCQADVQIGSQRILPFFPDLGRDAQG